MELESIKSVLSRSQNLILPSQRDENARLLDDSVRDSIEVEDDLIRSNAGLVRKVANRYARHMSHDLPFEDLIAAGNMGMLTAIRKFQREMNTAFSTYATHWIRQSIIRHIVDTGYRIRIPVHMYDRIMRIEKVIEYNPDVRTVEDWKALSGFGDREFEKVMEARQILRNQAVSLDDPVGDGNIGEDMSSTIGEFVGNPLDHNAALDPTEINLQKNLRDRISEALLKLDDREAEIIIRRFGLFDREEETLESLGNRFGITRERVRQIEAKALDKLSKVRTRYFPDDLG